MEMPLSPLDFARRARRLYGDREAVVDCSQSFTYEAFFDRCDRWSAALQSLGIRQGDRIACISPNTHAQLESFYAVPQLDAEFLRCLLRSRYYQRAFRAITTGHSNRRRTQTNDFEVLEIAFPEDVNEQRRLIDGVQSAREGQRLAIDMLRQEMIKFSDVIDGRGAEELPEVEGTTEEGTETQ